MDMKIIVRGNSIYTVVDGETFLKSEEESNKLGGYLVTIDDKKEDDFLTSNINQIINIGDYKGKITVRLGQSLLNDNDYKETEVKEIGYPYWIKNSKWSLGNNTINFNLPSSFLGSFSPYSAINPRINRCAAMIYYQVRLMKISHGKSYDHGKWAQTSPEMCAGMEYPYFAKIGIAEIPFINDSNHLYVVIENKDEKDAKAVAKKLDGEVIYFNAVNNNKEWLNDNFPSWSKDWRKRVSNDMEKRWENGTGVVKINLSSIDNSYLYPKFYYSDSFNNYNFYKRDKGKYEIETDIGFDEITGVSEIEFSDKKINFLDDIKGVFDQVTGLNTNSGEMFRLYNAAFARFPDADGLKYWIDQFSSGENTRRVVAQSFLGSSEFTEKYGSNVSDETYVNNLYKNVLGREADTEGLNYWVGNLSSGLETRYEALLGFAESAENKALFTDMTGFG